MSKRGYISRYLLILKKLKQKSYCNFEEMQQYLDREMRYLQDIDDTLSIGFSKRTFQRDIHEISNLFGIEIAYSKSQKGYYIAQQEMQQMNFQRMLEEFDLFHALHITHSHARYIHSENRKPAGTENFAGLLHAITNRLQVQFSYEKFWNDERSHRKAEPYVLKEFRQRWYVLARDKKDGIVKSFALDRLSALEISRTTFVYPADFDAEQYYRYCFGIIGPNAEKPADIILSFDPEQGKYIKSLPLHSTQVVLTDNEDEYRIRLCLYLTRDFIMEILSLGAEVRVIQPPELIKEIQENHQAAAHQYQHA